MTVTLISNDCVSSSIKQLPRLDTDSHRSPTMETPVSSSSPTISAPDPTTPPPKITPVPLAHATGMGIAAGILGRAPLQWLDAIVVRQQLTGLSIKGAITDIGKPRNFLWGFSPAMQSVALQRAGQFMGIQLAEQHIDTVLDWAGQSDMEFYKRDALKGMFGGCFFETTALQPFEAEKTRRQQGIRHSFGQLLPHAQTQQGWRRMIVPGIGANCLRNTYAGWGWFGLGGYFRSQFSPEDQEKLPIRFGCTFTAAMLLQPVTIPLQILANNKTMTPDRSYFTIAKTLIQQEGLKGIYRGGPAKTVFIACMAGTTVTLNDLFTKFYKERHSNN